MVIVFSTEDIAIGEEQPRVDYWKSLGANDFLVMLINHSDRNFGILKSIKNRFSRPLPVVPNEAA